MTGKERRRANRRKKHERQALLEMRNMCGSKDLTPYNAVLQMRTNGKAEIVFYNVGCRKVFKSLYFRQHFITVLIDKKGLQNMMFTVTRIAKSKNFLICCFL